MDRIKDMEDDGQLAFLRPAIPDLGIMPPEDMAGRTMPSVRLEEVVLETEADFRNAGIRVDNTSALLRGNGTNNGTSRGIENVVNNMPVYGVAGGNLNTFASDSVNDYYSLQHFSHGLIDMERISPNILHELFQRMNTVEIAAMLVGYGKIKTNGRVKLERAGRKTKFISYGQFGRESFESIISRLVGIGFGYVSIKRMQKKGFREHDTNPNALRARMSKLPDYVKSAFLLNFNAPLPDAVINQELMPHRILSEDQRQTYTLAKIRDISGRIGRIYEAGRNYAQPTVPQQPQ